MSLAHTLQRLESAISTVCPVVSVRGTGPDDADFDPTPDATPEQIAAGKAALAAFDWSPEAHRQWELQQSIAAGLAGLMADDSPVACGLRFYLRILTDSHNECRRALGLSPILEGDLPTLARDYGFLAAPGKRADVDG